MTLINLSDWKSTSRGEHAPVSGTASRPSESGRTIPSLDGLRAFSILTVIVAHSRWFFPDFITYNSVFHFVIGNGTHGVAVFFVISGFLITSLLLKEFDKTGTVSLKHFYFRRTLRIFPPFYALLVVMGLLWWLNVIPEDLRSFVACATYTWAYFPWGHGYFIFHSWSLSIEEQFYLLWPLFFVTFHRRTTLLVSSLWIIAVMPCLRVLLYFAAPTLRGHEFYMVHGWIDTMMVGCVLALVRHQGHWQMSFRKYVNGWSAIAMAIIAFYVNPLVQESLPKSLAGIFLLGISPTVTALCVGGVLIYLTETRNKAVYFVFNNRLIRHVGVLSYSLYLWQQLFMAEPLHLLPYGFLFLIGAAECSHWLVERPSFGLRAYLENLWWPRTRQAATP